MSNESLYTRHKPSFSAKLAAAAPEGFDAFVNFNRQIFQETALTVKVKELIAVAVAHITGCPYCIDGHVGKAKGQQASFEEIFEAIAVAAAVSAHSAFYNAVNALNAYEGGKGEELYARSNLDRLGELEEVNEELYTAFSAFQHTALKAGLVGDKEKYIIAVAAAHVTGNAYSIELFTSAAKQRGLTLEELAETLLVAAALKAGAAMAHRVNALEAFDR